MKELATILYGICWALIAACAWIPSVDGQSATTSNGTPYLIRQRQSENGTVELYSPYFLWNPRVRLTFNLLSEPIKVFSNRGKLDIKITVEVATISNGLFSYRSRVYCYESICSSPGPTLIVERGDSVRIELVNNLDNTPGYSSLPEFADEIFYPNRTNLFFQSLPIDPKINSPFRFAEGGGDSIVYSFRVPKDISTGLHWYHSHVHGVSALHVMGGLFGAFVIEQRDTSSYPAEFAFISRQLLVMSHIYAQKNNSLYLENIPNAHAFSLQDENFEKSSLSFTHLSEAYGSNIPVATTFAAANQARVDDAWLVNNQYQPTYITSPGAWVILDILVASGDRIVELELRTGMPNSDNNELACDLRLLARNGYYFDEARTGDAVRHLILLQGDRASLAVMCPTNGTYYLQSIASVNENDAYYNVGDWTTKSTQVIAQIQTYGSFNDNSTSIGILLQNLTFLKTDVSEKNLLKKYNLQSSQSLSQLSISTAQNSPLWNRWQESMNPCSLQNADSMTMKSFYLIGAGSNCRNPCYDDILCAALSGTQNFSVDTFPVVFNHECSFAATQVLNSGVNLRDCTSQVNVSAKINAVWAMYNSNLSHSVNVSEILPGTVMFTTSRRLYQVHLYGYASFPYPIYMQNHDLQMLSFENVNLGISNILRRDDYIPKYNYDMGDFGLEFSDRRDSLVPLQGKTSFLVEFLSDTNDAGDSIQQESGLYPILSTYLKFSDRGFLRFVHIKLTNDSSDGELPIPPTEPPTLSPSPILPPTITTNYSQSVKVDSNAEEFLCDVSGGSSLYQESIDMTSRTRIIHMNSCPNHFSVCQNTQCGGDMKTRALKWYRELRIPLYPVLAAEPQDMTCSADMVGVAVNGVGIFSPAEFDKEDRQDCKFFRNDTRSRFGRTPCVAGFRGEGLLSCGDATQLNRKQIDKCGGYSEEFYHNQYFSGLYRYTSLPTCLLHQLTNASAPPSTLTVPKQGQLLNRKGHSVQIGWALDGFPIYGPTGIRNILMRRCTVAGAHPQICLDNCNGYYGRLPGVDEYLYRYYMTGNHTMSEVNGDPGEDAPKCAKNLKLSNVAGQSNSTSERCDRLHSPCCRTVVPDVSFFPYTVGCFRGCLLSNEILRRHGIYSKQSCFLTSKPATTKSFIPRVASSVANSLYEDPESRALYGHEVPMVNTIATMNGDFSSVSSQGDVSSSINGSTAFVSSLRENRRVLYRDPFDLSIDVISARISERDVVTGDVLSATVNEIILGGSREQVFDKTAGINRITSMNPINNQNFTYDKTDGTVNTLAAVANADHYFSGIVLDHRCHMLYFTDQQRIYKHRLDAETALPVSPIPTLVVGGIIKVDLFGFNLGVNFEDILQITVKKDHICTSIVHVSSRHVSCLLTSSIAMVNDTQDGGSSLHAQDVMVRTISGRTYGISLDATSQVAAGVTRPVLTRVHFNRLPLAPYGLSLIIDPMGDVSSIPTSLLDQTSGKSSLSDTSMEYFQHKCITGDDVTLYWTNTAAPSKELGHDVQRIRGNGLQLEIVLANVKNGRGILAMPVILDTADSQLIYIHDHLWTITNRTINHNTDQRQTFPVVTPNFPLSGECLGTGYEFARLLHDQQPLFPFDNYSSTIEPTYEELMQYLYLTNIDPRSFLGKCRHRLGHTLVIASDQELVKFNVLPIQPSVIFQPYVSYDATGLFEDEFVLPPISSINKNYLTTVLFQGISASKITWLWSTVLFTNMTTVQSVEKDMIARRLYVTTRDAGLVFSVSLDTLLTARGVVEQNILSKFILSSLNVTLSAYQRDAIHNNTVLNGRFAFHLWTMGNIRVAINSSSGLLFMIPQNQSEHIWPVAMDIGSWQLHCVSNQVQRHRFLWPFRDWMQLIHCGNLLTRAHGIVVLPIPMIQPQETNLTANEATMVSFPYRRKQRILLVDTNQHQLVAIREQGTQPVSSTDLGRHFQVVFPHQLIWFRSILIDNNKHNNASSSQEEWTHEFLLSEYMGKLWKISVLSTEQNATLHIENYVLKPSLVIDWSAFMVSIKVREILASEREDGVPTYESIFFEASL